MRGAHVSNRADTLLVLPVDRQPTLPAGVHAGRRYLVHARKPATPTTPAAAEHHRFYFGFHAVPDGPFTGIRGKFCRRRLPARIYLDRRRSTVLAQNPHALRQ